LPLPATLPPKLIGSARRIDSRKEICRIASQFKNCLSRYMGQVDDGNSAVYVWDKPDVQAVCHVPRHGRLGWALDRPLGPRNTDLNDPDYRRITSAFAAAGIPPVDVVQTIEAIAYLRFSRRGRGRGSGNVSATTNKRFGAHPGDLRRASPSPPPAIQQHFPSKFAMFGFVGFAPKVGHWAMSALPPIADISRCLSDVRFVPKTDIAERG
jgi:hypothetical protein